MGTETRLTSPAPLSEPKILGDDGNVAVWFGIPAAILGGLSQPDALRTLDTAEQARYAAFRFEPDRLAYLAAHLLHRQVWGQLLSVDPGEVQISHDPDGRLNIIGPDGAPRFSSLSRRRGLVAVATSKWKTVGVDVEETAARPAADVLSRFLSPGSYLSAIGEIETNVGAFAKIWTLIEAFAKVSGEGLSDNLRSVDISALTEGRYIVADARVRCLAISHAPDTAHYISVAWRSD